MHKSLYRYLLNYKYIFLLIIVCFVICFSNSMTLNAESSDYYYENDDTGYCAIIEDDAYLFSTKECYDLLVTMEEITKYGNAALKTIDVNYDSTSYFAENYYYDLFRSNSGILFLIDMDNRTLYIYCDGNIYKTITIDYANTITDNVYRYAAEEDYFTCSNTVFEQAIQLLEGKRIAQPMKYISNTLLAINIALLINFVIVIFLSNRNVNSSVNITNGIKNRFSLTDIKSTFIKQSKVYSSPVSSSSGSGGSHRSSGSRSRSSYRSSSRSSYRSSSRSSSRSSGGSRRSGGGGGHRF